MSWSLILHNWSLEPLVLASLGAAAVLYYLGVRSAPRPAWRMICFYAGLLTIFIALESAVDAFDGQLFWVHMLQHLLLIMVAAPLLVLGDPAIPVLRAWPLGSRRRTLRVVTTATSMRSIGRVMTRVASPWSAALILIADLYFWHWTPLFNLTLQNQVVHDVEHLCFLSTALLFWMQVVDQRGVHVRFSYLQRAGYVVLVGAAGNLLAMYFVFALRPLYPAYAALHPRPFGIGALMDQQLAGALMWVPVLFVFAGAFAVCLYRWLGEEEVRSSRSNPVTVPGYRLLDGTLSSET